MNYYFVISLLIAEKVFAQNPSGGFDWNSIPNWDNENTVTEESLRNQKDEDGNPVYKDTDKPCEKTTDANGNVVYTDTRAFCQIVAEEAKINKQQQPLVDFYDSQKSFLEEFNGSGVTLDDPFSAVKSIIDKLYESLKRIQTMGDRILAELDTIKPSK